MKFNKKITFITILFLLIFVPALSNAGNTTTMADRLRQKRARTMQTRSEATTKAVDSVSVGEDGKRKKITDVSCLKAGLGGLMGLIPSLPNLTELVCSAADGALAAGNALVGSTIDSYSDSLTENAHFEYEELLETNIEDKTPQTDRFIDLPKTIIGDAR